MASRIALFQPSTGHGYFDNPGWSLHRLHPTTTFRHPLLLPHIRDRPWYRQHARHRQCVAHWNVVRSSTSVAAAGASLILRGWSHSGAADHETTSSGIHERDPGRGDECYGVQRCDRRKTTKPDLAVHFSRRIFQFWYVHCECSKNFWSFFSFIL